jgi:hypothetical protein
VVCNISLKLNFLHSHLDFFPEHTSAISDKHFKRFHQDISQTEKRYSGKWSQNMFSDYCFGLIKETPTDENKRQKKTKEVFSDFFIIRIPYIKTLFII